MNTRMLHMSVALTLGASILAGCSSAAERAIERSAPGTEVEIERGGDRIVIEDEDGSLEVETGAELPEEVSDAFAVPSDYVVDLTSSVTDGALTFVTVSGHLERSDLRTLTDELTAAIGAAGWTIVTSFSSGEDVQLIGAERGEQQLQVSIAAEPGSSRFDVVINVSVGTG